ncbi:MAG: hypothetical protein M1818_002829 [Claussenomyces sp. TS43310]|nr:MAG: hypothetical protein M1818_002829 [Claussenomyces sp. TS43310]
MPAPLKDVEVYRLDARHNHELLTPAEREKLIKPHLPAPPQRRKRQVASASPSESNSLEARSRLGVRIFLRNQFYALTFAIIHAVFSVYIRLRKFYHAIVDRIFAILYYHHRTPELIKKDVKALKRLPEHLSVILTLEDRTKGGAGLEALVDEVAEISAWCACAGIPVLSIYEETGVLKNYIPATHRAITRKFSSYFGSQHPAISLRAPHVSSIESAPTTPTSHNSGFASSHISVLLLSSEDGRDSIVDLTKTLTEMSQRSKLSAGDISIDLVDAELSESVTSEPDLLILFSPTVELSGYPPWQVRLTEIFYVQDNQGVGYQVFLRALHKFAHAQMRFGR